MTFICTSGPGGVARGLSISPWLCPWCRGTGSWGDGERCMECAGSGQVDTDAKGHDLTHDGTGEQVQPVKIARPPAIMAAPCSDCAFRPGSPEQLGEQEPADQPFHCHHGLTRVGDGYVAPAYLNGMPIGAMVCAGWWAARVEGKPLPRVAFRDPGGSDRTASAPR